LRVQKLIKDELGSLSCLLPDAKRLTKRPLSPTVPCMNISDQISALWAARQEKIGLVWTLLPDQGQAETAVHLQQQILNTLLMAPFAAHAGRLVGEQLAQQFRLSLEKLGTLQQLLAGQLFQELDEAQTAWLAPRLTAFWAEMTVGYGYKLRKLYLADETMLPEKILADLQQATAGEPQFMALFNATYSPVVLHKYGRILAINPAITRVFGYTAEELVGQEIAALVSRFAPPSEQETIRQHSTAGGSYTYQTRCLSQDGTEIPIQVTARRIAYDGRPVRLIVLRPLTPAFKPLLEPEEVNLTTRQQEVLYHLATGLNDQAIAEMLCVSLSTIKKHNQEIFAKLQVTTRVAAAFWAWQKLDSFNAFGSA
jgi:PAS domain S-box-containing protein